MGKFEDLLELLLEDDDDEEMTIEIHLSEDEPEEEQPKGKQESKPSKDEESEDLREKAVAQHKEIEKTLGKDKADAIVDFAAHCAMIAAMVRDNIQIDQELVDEYNALCEEVHPEGCDPFVKAVHYVAYKDMINKGKKALE